MTGRRPRIGVEMLGQAVAALVPARLQLGHASGRGALSPCSGCLLFAGCLALPGGLLLGHPGNRRGCARLCLVPLLARFCLLLGPRLLALLLLQGLAFFLACLPRLHRLPQLLQPQTLSLLSLLPLLLRF